MTGINTVERSPDDWYVCQCSCGNKSMVHRADLESGAVEHCGCQNARDHQRRQRDDVTLRVGPCPDCGDVVALEPEG